MDKTQTTLGINSTIIETSLQLRDDAGIGAEAYDLHINTYQKTDTAFINTQVIWCVNKEEILKLSENLRKLVTED
jgi:hypothetical protein